MHRLRSAFLFSLLILPAVAFAEPPGHVVGFLWRGPAWTSEKSARIDSLQAGHMANLIRRYQEGSLVGSGPILDPKSALRGLFFFKATSVAEVSPLVATDPAIAAGRLRIDLVPWRGPEGLGDEYRQAHTADPKLGDSMMRYVVALIEPAAGSRALNARHSTYMKGLGTKVVMDGALTDGRELAVFATADTAQVREWMKDDSSARVLLWPWTVAKGVIPGH